MSIEKINKDMCERTIFLYGEQDEVEEFIKKYHTVLNIQAVLTDLKKEEIQQPYAKYQIKMVMFETVDFTDELIIICARKGFEGKTKRLRHLHREEHVHYISQELAESFIFDKKTMLIMGTRLMYQVFMFLKQSQFLVNRYNIIYFDEYTIREPFADRFQEYLHICKVCDVHIRSSCEKERFHRKVISKKMFRQDCRLLTVADYGFFGFFPQYDKTREKYSDLFLRERERLDVHYGTFAVARKETELESLCKEGKTDDDIIDKVMSNSYFSEEYIYNYFDEEVKRFSELEVEDDVKLSQFIQLHRNCLLCRNLDEWNEPLVSYVVDSLLQILGFSLLQMDVEEKENIIENNSGSEFLIYPSVRSALKLPTKTRYRVTTYYSVQYLNDIEYIKYLIKYYKKAYDLIMFMGVDEELGKNIKGINDKGDNMRERILEVIKNFNEELTEDLNKDLLASEMLDSFDVVKLVIALENEFDMEIDEDYVTPENFQTVNTIINTIIQLVNE